MINKTIKKLFASDFEELEPVKKRWWHKINFDNVRTREIVLIAVVVVPVAIMAMYYYNKFIELSRFTEMEQHQIDVLLQRRKDLSINLMTTVINYAEHERNMYQYMADRRTDSLKKTDLLLDTLKKSGFIEMAEKVRNGEIDSEAISKFMALGEAYPDLKLSANYQKLMDSLVASEDKIADRRMEYNRAASVFHAYVKKIPACVFAYIYGYKEKMFHYAEVDTDAKNFNRIRRLEKPENRE
jgi:LemA protein